MGALFRGKMLAALRAAHARGDIDLGEERESLLGTLYRKRWIVYAKRPFGDAAQVVRYLGLYTHRVGISNRRIEHIASDAVRFRTRDDKRATLTPAEFLRRFLLHVLPSRFVKIRHFGLLAPGNAHRALERHERSSPRRPRPPRPTSRRAPGQSYCSRSSASTYEHARSVTSSRACASHFTTIRGPRATSSIRRAWIARTHVA